MYHEVSKGIDGRLAEPDLHLVPLGFSLDWREYNQNNPAKSQSRFSKPLLGSSLFFFPNFLTNTI